MNYHIINSVIKVSKCVIIPQYIKGSKSVDLKYIVSSFLDLGYFSFYVAILLSSIESSM